MLVVVDIHGCPTRCMVARIHVSIILVVTGERQGETDKWGDMRSYSELSTTCWCMIIRIDSIRDERAQRTLLVLDCPIQWVHVPILIATGEWG